MPLNPDAPPPILRERAVTAVRTAARKHHNSLFVLYMGGVLGFTVAFTSGDLFAAGAAALTFLFGAAVQSATGGK